jgi:hypothetical protein
MVNRLLTFALGQVIEHKLACRCEVAPSVAASRTPDSGARAAGSRQVHLRRSRVGQLCCPFLGELVEHSAKRAW